MRRHTGKIARALAAAVAAAAAVSCPTPINRELLLIVEDEIGPDLAITSPTANSYYHGTVHVSGALGDSSSEAGDGLGRIRTLSFAVNDYSPLDRTVTFDAAGNAAVDPPDPTFAWDPATGVFSFDFPSIDLQSYRVLTFIATDANGNETRREVGLLPYPYGPHIALDNPIDLSTYTTEVYIDGTVCDSSSDGTTDEVRALKWEATGEPSKDLVLGPATLQGDGTYLDDGFSYDPDTGAFGDWFDSSGHTEAIMIVKVSAQNASLVWSSVTVQLVYNSTGPALALAAAAPGHNPTDYSSVATTAITVDGTVDLANYQAGTLRYYAIQPSGRPQSAYVTPYPWGAFSFTFDPSGGNPALSGNLTIEVSAKDTRGVLSTVSYTCYDDTVAPAAPTVSGPSTTYSTTPTWTWNTPAETVEFRHSLDSGTGPWTTTPLTSWTPSSDLGLGGHTLYVQGRDAVGNWSGSGSWTVTIEEHPDPPEP